jgi:ligand-binding sensor domain-containing protein
MRRRWRLWQRLRRWWSLGVLPLALACGGDPPPPAVSPLAPPQGDVPPPLLHAPPLPLALEIFDGRQRAPGDARDLSLDAGGGVWVVSADGVYVRPAGKTFFRTLELPGSEATAVGGLAEGVALVGHEKGPMSLVKLAADGTASVSPLDLAGYVHHIRVVQGAEGPHAFVAGAMGLALVEGDGRVAALRRPDPPAEELWSLAAAPDGALWFATFEKLVRVPGALQGDLSAPPDPRLDLEPGAQDRTYALDVCANGDIWAATLGNGVYRLSSAGQTVAHLRRSGVLPQDHVISVACDPQGGVWLGTSWGGIARLHTDGTVDYHTRDAGLPGDSVRALVPQIEATGDRAMWIGTEHGVAVYRGP